MALPLVLWAVALLSLMAAGVFATVRSEIALVHGRQGIAEAQALADAGVSLAILGLHEEAPSRWRADGTPRRFTLFGGKVTVAAQDEGGKIDINHSDEALLAGLVAEVAGEREAEAIAAAIVAERKRDGKGVFGPPGLMQRLFPFSEIEELMRIPGLDEARYARIAPSVTVHSGRKSINPLTAPRSVLLAVPGASERDVDSWLVMRTEEAEPRRPAVDPYHSRTHAQAVSITAVGETASGTRFVREAIVVITRNSAQPWRVLSWRRRS
jgi:general secretion pathway protein K